MQKSKNTKSSKRSIFQKENEILAKCDEIIKNPHIEKSKLLDEFKFLTSEYKKILRSFAKITRLSDSSTKKLFHTHDLLKIKSQELEEINQKLYEVSITDQLTQIYNRGFLLEAFATEFQKSKRYNFTLSCIMLDIDHFKKINDKYGHLTGDFILKDITRIIQESIRQADTFGRYGGEEFMIVIPYVNSNKAFLVAEKIRKLIDHTEFVSNGTKIKATISLGVSDNKSTSITTIDDMIKRSDDALYKAKNDGRNRTRIFKQGM